MSHDLSHEPHITTRHHPKHRSGGQPDAFAKSARAAPTVLECWPTAVDTLTMARRPESAKVPSDATIALSVAVSLLLFAWGLGEIMRSL